MCVNIIVAFYSLNRNNYCFGFLLPSIPIQSKVDRMKDLILLTEIIIFEDVILSEEDETGLTKLYFDQNLKPVEEGKQIKFSYQLGSYSRFLMEYVTAE